MTTPREPGTNLDAHIHSAPTRQENWISNPTQTCDCGAQRFRRNYAWSAWSGGTAKATPVSDEEIVARFLEGEPIADIAEQHGVHRTTVQDRIKRLTGKTATQIRQDNGLVPRQDSTGLAVARILAGEPASDVASDIGLSITGLSYRVQRDTGFTPTQLLRSKGLPTAPSANTHPEVSDDEIVAKILKGEAQSVIAEQHGFSTNTVARRVLRHTGLTPTQLRQQQRSQNITAPPTAAGTPSQPTAQAKDATSPSPSRPRTRNGTLTDPEIIEALLADDTIKAIAKRCGVSHETLCRITRVYTGMSPAELRRANGWGSRAVSAHRSREIVAAYRDDSRLTVQRAAQMFGVSAHAVRTVLAAYSVPIDPTRQSSPSSPDKREEIADLYLGGMTTVEIADWFGINESSVRRALDAQRVKRRKIHESKEILRRRRTLDAPFETPVRPLGAQ